MSRKRNARRSIGHDTPDETRAMSIEELAGQGYGDLSSLAKGSGRIVAKPIDIFAIRPDPIQPRRTIPTVLAATWNHQPDTTGDLFGAWLERIEEASGRSYDLVARLQLEESDEVDAQLKPIERAFNKLCGLAASIRKDGLTNPITVVRDGDTYVIETGERRWLAYHLLYWHTGDDDWSQIPARDTGEFSIWRQATENNARDNLNAIAKARQFALLLMELHGRERFQPHTDFDHKRDFYAQVADSHAYRVPRGTGDQLLNAIGASHRTQLTHYRKLLTLPEIVWTVADDLDWTEFKIRELMTQAETEADLIDLAIRQAKVEGYTLTGVNISQLPGDMGEDDVDTASVELSPVQRLIDRSARLQERLEKYAAKASDDERDALSTLAKDQLTWWRDFLTRLDEAD